MSGIYFHSIDGEVRVSGSERAHFGLFCQDLAWNLVGRHAKEYDGHPSPLRGIFPESHYLRSSKDFSRDARNYFCGRSDEFIFVDGKRISIFYLQLNTALCLGNDFVKLAARIHGQCEIHCYVEGCNRKWLAGIIQDGFDSGFYRDGMGWPDVINLLSAVDDSPVVMSYSVCERFPSALSANVDGDSERDAWLELPKIKKWSTAMSGLRKSNSGLELKPDDWNFPNFQFGNGETATWLAEHLFKEKVFVK